MRMPPEGPDRTTGEGLSSTLLTAARIVLTGSIDDGVYARFREQLSGVGDAQAVVLELSTLGGDADVARTIAEDIRLQIEAAPQRRFLFLGKATVYSAGVTIMAAFAADTRFLTPTTRLMIHERKLDKRVHLTGALTRCADQVQALAHEVERSIAIQNEGFASLVAGSRVSIDEVRRRAPTDWYLDASEAVELGLVAGLA